MRKTIDPLVQVEIKAQNAMTLCVLLASRVGCTLCTSVSSHGDSGQGGGG